MIKLIHTIREVIGHNSICSSNNYYKFKNKIAIYKSMAMKCPYLCEISMLETIKYYEILLVPSGSVTCFPVQGVGVRSLVTESRYHMLNSATIILCKIIVKIKCSPKAVF